MKYECKNIYKLLPEPKNGVIGKLLCDNTEYFAFLNNQVKTTFNSITSLAGLVLKGGNFNGYVIVLPEHPFYGKDYDEINELLVAKDFYVHGGLTFSAGDKEHFPELNELYSDYWVFGFDTRHAGDTEEYWTEERTWEETDNLMQAVINYKE